MARSLTALLFEGRLALSLGSQGALGEALGSSPRSGQRWERGESQPTPNQLHAFARLVYPVKAALAAEIAEAGGTTLASLGIVPPEAPASVLPPPPPRPDPVHLVDTVVCAAAEAMQLMPEAVRPALRAAFRRARMAGLSVEEVDDALGGRSAGAGAGAAIRDSSSGPLATKLKNAPPRDK